MRHASCGAAGCGQSRLVVDVNSLKVYEHQDIFQKWYPASLTKLMTAYTAFRAIKSGQLTLEPGHHDQERRGRAAEQDVL